MPTYSTHPAADLSPVMPPSELAALAADIRRYGLREPIALLDGQALDGRHRLRACEMAECEPRYRELTVSDVPDPIAYVVSANLHRRHLNESQRAMIGARISERRRAERANLRVRRGQRERSSLGQLRVSRRSVDFTAVVLREGSPELIAAVDGGEVAVSRAADIAANYDPDHQLSVVESPPQRLREAILVALADGQARTPEQTGEALRARDCRITDRVVLRELRKIQRSQPPDGHLRRDGDRYTLSIRATDDTRETAGEALCRQLQALICEIELQCSREPNYVSLRRLARTARELRRLVSLTIEAAATEAALASVAPRWIAAIVTSADATIERPRRHLLRDHDD